MTSPALHAHPMRVLILGGSAEASALAHLLATDGRFKAILSLAGRTISPRPQPIETRSGGFGGVDGLARHLKSENIDALIDATHPFAAQMSRNAIAAARLTRTPLLGLERPAWKKEPGDHWIEVPDVPSAVEALGSEPRTVFSAIGSLALADFYKALHHRYIVRLIDLPAQPLHLPGVEIIQARGPFTAEDDIRLFREHDVEVVLAKNSGGEATISKIEAARALRLPVVLVARPFIPHRPCVSRPADAVEWLAAHYDVSAERGV